jgi:SH3-like domain-containing protein
MTREVRFQRTSAALLGLFVTALASSASANSTSASSTPAEPTPAAAQDALRYVQSASKGAKVRNVPDPAGLLVADIPSGTPLAVHDEKTGYLHVSSPGGYRVWVYGSLLAESGRPGWLELTGNQVNMRPEPRTQNSFPIGQLHKGDRVRIIQRADASLPMSEDWVEVWSPSTAKAWVAKSETSALPAGSDGAALFGMAATAAAQGRGTTQPAAKGSSSTASGGQAAAGSTAATKGELFAALATAQGLMREAIASDAPNFAEVRAAYAEVYLLNPDPNTRRIVERDLDQVKLHEELLAERAKLNEQRKALDAERERQERIRREAELRKDPLWGRFESRGWLSSESVKGGGKRYIVSYSGDRKQVIECTSGRYDLELFVGYEVGVEGLLSGRNAAAELPTVDARSIEVISGRYRR